MSHFSVMVVTEPTGNANTDFDKVNEALAPFEEELEVKPYIKYEKTKSGEMRCNEIKEYEDKLNDPEAEKKYNIPFIKSRIDKLTKTSDEEYFKELTENYDSDEFDEKGNVLSTYNPQAKWDWFSIGGRWKNSLRLKSGTMVDSALKKDLDNEKDWCTFAILKDGSWTEMGWWGIVSKEKKDWLEIFREIYNSISENSLITIVDCHI